MARDFNGSSQYLEYTGAAISSMPITMAAWFNSDSATVEQTIISISAASGSTQGWRLSAMGDVAGDPLRAISTANGTPQVATTTPSGYSTSTWHHGCAIFTSSTSRAVFIDGGSKGTNSTGNSPGTVNRTSIGSRFSAGSRVDYFNGRIAEAAIWNVTLTDAEVAVLATGVCPLLVRPASIVAYWPIFGRTTNENPHKGEIVLTTTGATYSEHPRIFYPKRKFDYSVPAAGGGGGLVGPLVGGRFINSGPLLRGRLITI